MKELAEKIDKCLYQNRKDFPAETVYEITTLKDRLPFGIAIADIEQSVPHFHRVTHETYTVVQGELEVSLGTDKHRLAPGDVIQIPPNMIHSARSLGSLPARITVTTIPEFSPDDYFAVPGTAQSENAEPPSHTQHFETRQLPDKYDYPAPDGSQIRLLPNMQGGGLCHCTLPPGTVTQAITHRTVDEIWYCLSGNGEVWRRQGGVEETTMFTPGTSLTIPRGTHFQFRSIGSESLCFIITTMPPWPGKEEAVKVNGCW